MSFDGFEVDMLTLGDADCILVTRWGGGTATRVLVDGGNAGDVDTVRQFLTARGVKIIEHVVCSHPHDDHAAGLVELLKDTQFSIGRLWVHQPWLHIDSTVMMRAWGQRGVQRTTAMLRKSVETQLAVVRAAQARGIPLDLEPLAGQHVGPLFVCGPSKEFYEAMLLEFTDLAKLAAYESAYEERERQRSIEDAIANEGGAEPETGLLDDPQTNPENNSATILWAKHGEQTFVFTSDAGVPAMRRAQKYAIGNCYWMQLPHHGSRHNITSELIQWFSPKIGYVSAAGNVDHPRRAVVNAFKEVGCRVFSAHYPTPTNMWIHTGSVPSRTGYSPLTALYEAKT